MDRYIRYSDVLEKASSSSGVKQKITVIRNTALELLFDSYIKYYGIDSGIDFDVTYIDEVSYISNNNENNDTIVILNLKEISPWIFDNIYVLQDDQIQAESDKIKAYLLPLLNKLKNISAQVLFFNFEKDYFESECKGTIPINKIINTLNVFIASELEGNQNVYLIDINRVIAQIGAYNFYDKRGYYLNSSLYSKEGCNALAHKSVRKLNVIYGKSKKCIVLDCDNVLWGGAIVDDGIDNIKLGQVYPGNAFQDFQREIIKLCHQGIIICLCSKNNEHDVISVLQNHPDMLLKPEYIAAYKINWNNKADNINELSEELNIGLDSMVFIDDSEYEIGLINKELPQIKTIHLNAEQPHEYADILNHCGLFEKIHVTDEDEKRAALYIEKSKRSTYKQSFTNLEAYHKSLETILTIKYTDNFSVPRLAQLSQRTNQFNLTAKKYSEQDLYDFINSETYDVILLSAQDIFGAMGIVGCAIIHYVDNIAIIEAFMLSCRVFCRGFEDVLLSQICKLTQSKGYLTITGKYNQTEKNKRFSDFYSKHMFINNVDSYEINSNISITFPNHFKEIRGL
jgi:FkbH-like protein